MNSTATFDYGTLKINGVYQQNAAGDLMVRVKLPGGILSAVQAEAISDLSDNFSNGVLHLTCRGNIEIHGLCGEYLPQVFRRYRAVGLTTRGACGGAVRSVLCTPSGGQDFARVQMLVRVLHEHFTGNPYFEGLPKKIKLAVENGELDEVDLLFGDHITLSIYPSYELVIDRLSIILQPGFYLYRKKTADLSPAFYQRIGVKYHFWKDYFAGVSLRAYQYHVSDFIEWNIGRRIKW